ncbi:MAG: malto-oligosyltrehalose trehalohydrolase [Gemmataceae bacterium]
MPDWRVLFRVWAPKAEEAQLVLHEDEGPRIIAMTREVLGYFRHEEGDLDEGTRYSLRLDGGSDRPDPCSMHQPDGVHKPSAVIFPDLFPWTDNEWRGVPRRDLVVYELHVGTFTPAGTFEDIIPRLESLKQLGITAIEIMPVAQFPGARNWGYDGVHPYAVQNSYGGPHGLQKLVDACHDVGLACILDVVYNHFGPEGNYLNEFGPYFTDRYKTPWGTAVNYDGSGSDGVREYILDNVRMWLEEYHLDGLRLDAVHAIYDFGACHILKAIKDVAREVEKKTHRRIHIIAESDLNDPRLMYDPKAGGCGLDAAWADDFHHAVHAFLTGEKDGYYADFGEHRHIGDAMRTPYVYASTYSPFRGRKHGAAPEGLDSDRFVVCIQNHDQVGNRATGERLNTLLKNPAKQRLATSLLLFSPYIPLLFMGEEYGEEAPFPFFCSFENPELIQAVREGRKREFADFAGSGQVPDPNSPDVFLSAKLSWSWPEGTLRDGMRKLHADLLAARREWHALSDATPAHVRWLAEGTGLLLEVVRGGGPNALGKTVRILFNLSDRSQAIDPPAANEKLLFTSESTRYGGAHPCSPAKSILAYECLAFGPAGYPCMCEAATVIVEEKKPAPRFEPEDVVADAGDGSFPASDPTSWSPLSGSPTHKCPTEDENARGETLEPFLAEVGVGCGA